MGYMGFGMQKWIYNRNPRKKLFEKRRFHGLVNVQNNSKEFLPKKKVESSQNKIILYLTAFVVLCFTTISISNFIDYSKKFEEYKMKQTENNNTKAFNFLIKSGKENLSNNKFQEAYYDFKLAEEIFPNHLTIQNLKNETFYMLCENENY